MAGSAELREVRRDALGIGFAAGAYAISFGAISVSNGLSVAQTCVLSLLMFTGASQFAFVGVVGAGGALTSGVATALLLGARNSLYGLRLAPLLRLGDLRRLLTAHFVIDETTAMATVRDDEPAARAAFWTTGVALFVLWNAGTLLGALSGSVRSDPATLGLDAAVPRRSWRCCGRVCAREPPGWPRSAPPLSR